MGLNYLYGNPSLIRSNWGGVIRISEAKDIPKRKKAVTVPGRAKACTVFARSEAGFVGSNPTQGMDILCVYAFILCLCCPVFR
jgi:hypothetical protein